jgi:site-specific DNA recombinase
MRKNSKRKIQLTSNPTKAVIFARVSSAEQKDNNSLDSQIFTIKAYCAKKSFEIIKQIKLVESSTRGEREQFYEMIDFIKKQKEPIALVVDAVDRLQRSFKEVPILEELRVAGRLTLHFLRENQILDKKANSAQLMAYQMFVMMAASFANSISDNVKRGFNEKRRNGESLGHVPIGYLTKDGEVTIDPFKSILARELLEEYSTGLTSVPELARKYGKKGLITRNGRGISVSQVDRMTSHPFYYGFIEDFDDDGNEILRPHKYEKIISKELFDRCQDVKHGRSYTKFKTTKQDFIFSTLVRCKHCNCTYSPYLKKKKYIYLRPNKGSKDCAHCINTNENILLKEVFKVIKSISIPQDVLEEIKSTLISCIQSKHSDYEIKISQINAELGKIRESIKNWNLRCASDMSITTNERHETMTHLKRKQEDLEYELSSLNTADEGFEITLNVLLELASCSHTLFESSSNQQKQRILQIIFSNLLLDGKNPYVTLAKPFDKFVNWSEFTSWSG